MMKLNEHPAAWECDWINRNIQGYESPSHALSVKRNIIARTSFRGLQLLSSQDEYIVYDQPQGWRAKVATAFIGKRILNIDIGSKLTKTITKARAGWLCVLFSNKEELTLEQVVSVHGLIDQVNPRRNLGKPEDIFNTWGVDPKDPINKMVVETLQKELPDAILSVVVNFQGVFLTAVGMVSDVVTIYRFQMSVQHYRGIY